MARPDDLAPPADSNPKFDPLTNPGQFLTQFEAGGDPVGSWFAAQRNIGVARDTNFPSVEGVKSLEIVDYDINNFGNLIVAASGLGVTIELRERDIDLWPAFFPLEDSPVIQLL